MKHLLILIAGLTALNAQYIIDDSFSVPPNVIGNAPLNGGVGFGTPRVASSTGVLNDDVLRFDHIGSGAPYYYSQMAFDFGELTQQFLIIECDLTFEDFVGENSKFTVFLDVPSVKYITFTNNGTVDYALSANTFEDDVAYKLLIRADTLNGTIGFFLDGQQVGTRSFNPLTQSPDQMRFSMGSSGYEETPSSSSAVGIDNFKVYQYGDSVEYFAVLDSNSHWGNVSGTGVYLSGTSVPIEAIPQSGYRFIKWSGDLSGKDNPTSLLVTSDTYVEAVFIPEDVYTGIYQEGQNAVTSSPNNFNLYSESQILAMSSSDPMIKMDPVTGNYTLNLKFKKSVDLDNFADFPIHSSSLSTNSDGEIEIVVTPPSTEDSAFYRIYID